MERSLNKNLRAFAEGVDPKSETTRLYLGMLIEHRKDAREQALRATRNFYICTASYWLLYYGQMSEISVFSIKVSGCEAALCILPLLSALFLYEMVLQSFHYVILEKFFKTFFCHFIPILQTNSLQDLLQSELSELKLANLGMLRKLPAFLLVFFTT